MTAMKYDPMPLTDDKMVQAIKSTFQIEDDLEARQPAIVRKFFAAMSSAVPRELTVTKQDREIEFEGVKTQVSILRPFGTEDKVLPVVLFLHGGGFIFGDYNSHGVAAEQLTNSLNACFVFVEYSLSPEVKYPVALHECYAALCWVQQNASELNVDIKTLTVAGDSAGGNLSTTLSIYAKEQQNSGISYQVLYYPCTGLDANRPSHIENKDDPVLNEVSTVYFKTQYLGQNYLDFAQDPLCAPVEATIEQLKGLPPAFVVTAEKDVLRDEGEAYAKKLKQAGVPTVCTRYIENHHGFLTPMSGVEGGDTQALIDQTVALLHKHWKSL